MLSYVSSCGQSGQRILTGPLASRVEDIQFCTQLHILVLSDRSVFRVSGCKAMLSLDFLDIRRSRNCVKHYAVEGQKTESRRNHWHLVLIDVSVVALGAASFWLGSIGSPSDWMDIDHLRETISSTTESGRLVFRLLEWTSPLIVPRSTFVPFSHIFLRFETVAR